MGLSEVLGEVRGGHMRTLGVNGAGDTLYFAVADSGEVLDLDPYVFAEPTGIPAVRRYAALRAEGEKVVRSLEVERVRILDPETTYAPPAVSVQKRFALETLLHLGACDAGVDCDRMSRARCRSLLELPKKGALPDLVKEATEKVGPHWARKRDLAALAALAAGRAV